MSSGCGASGSAGLGLDRAEEVERVVPVRVVS